MLLPPNVSRDELLSFVRPLYPNGIFPLGAGWRIVFYIIVAAFFAGVLIYHSPRMRRRREAFSAFKAMRSSFQSDGDVSILASALSVLIRRVALYRFGREKTAVLNGRDWIEFLKQTGADLSEKDQYLLENQAYAPSLTAEDRTDGRHLLGTVQKWLRRNL